MLEETALAIGFGVKHSFRTFGLYLSLAVVGIALFLVLFWMRGSVNQASVAAVLFAIILSQVAIASRIWTRLAFYAAELDLYRQLTPPVPRDIPPSNPPEDIEFLAAEPKSAIVLTHLIVHQSPYLPVIDVLQFDR